MDDKKLKDEVKNAKRYSLRDNTPDEIVEDFFASEEQAKLDALEAEGFELVGILDKNSTPEEELAIFEKLADGME